jgi:hypothetical protein
MASLDSVSSSLPILALSNANEIVFPGSQVTIAVPRTLAGPLSRLVKNVSANGEAPLVVATPRTPVPTSNSNTGSNSNSQSQSQARGSSSGPFADLKLFDWGCGKFAHRRGGS